jgi:hypothetical protein
VPPAPRFTLDDLWQVTLVKSGSSITAETWVNVSMNVYDKHGSKILSAATNKFHFIQNVISINKANLSSYQPITVNYYSNKFKSQLTQQGGIFPSGDYKVEVLANVGAQFTEPIGKYAYNITSQLMYPMHLLQVYNNDTIRDPNPMFTWVPPYPLPHGEIKYELVVAEIQPNQTPDVAVKENIPLFKTSVFNQTNHYYTAAAPKLIKGKEYAWHVDLYKNDEYITGSETWKFVYGPDDSMPIFIIDYYYVMDEDIYASYVTIDSNLLPIKFKEDYNVLDSIVEINLYDSLMNVFADDEEIILGYNTGSNLTYLNFCEYDLELPQAMYLLEIICLNDKKYYIRFNNISELGACF